jgi:large subunit ribosomal protein L23
MSMSLVLKPRVSEKAYGLSQVRNTYVFDVERAANKHTIARAVEAQYNVTVTEVNVVNAKGKAKRTVRKGGRPTVGYTSDVKKAYVTLKAGDSMPIFAAVEAEAAKEAETTAKLTKAAEKAAAKTQKAEDKSAAKAAKSGTDKENT